MTQSQKYPEMTDVSNSMAKIQWSPTEDFLLTAVVMRSGIRSKDQLLMFNIRLNIRTAPSHSSFLEKQHQEKIIEGNSPGVDEADCS